MVMKDSILICIALYFLSSCSFNEHKDDFDPDLVLPKEIIDLSPIIGEELPELKWGKAALKMMNLRVIPIFI